MTTAWVSSPLYLAEYAKPIPEPIDEPNPKRISKKAIQRLQPMGVSMMNLNTVHWLMGAAFSASGISVSSALSFAGDSEVWRVSCSSDCVDFKRRFMGVIVHC